MNFESHLNEAFQLASRIPNWEEAHFSWKKAYVASVFSALAYEEVPQFELANSKRAKIIPCDRYQSHVSRWESLRQPASIRNLNLEYKIEAVIRGRVIAIITRMANVIFVSFRGTTFSFNDLIRDVDCKKIQYSLGYGPTVQIHRGFFDALMDCFDEVVDFLCAMRASQSKNQHTPLYITGHSLGGAMAAIFHARLNEVAGMYRHRYRHRVLPAISCYSFGMPRYGDTTAKFSLPQPIHIFNELDMVPTFPPYGMDYSDVPGEKTINAIPEEIILETKGNFALRHKRGMPTILGVSDHRMENYVDRIDHLRGN